MLAPRLEVFLMIATRMERAAVVVGLTFQDGVTFGVYWPAIWQAWGRNTWAQMLLLLFPAIWIGTLVVLWRSVIGDLWQTIVERRHGSLLGSVPTEDRLEGSRDV